MTILLNPVLLNNWSESCCLGEGIRATPWRLQKCPELGSAAGVVLSSMWVRAQARKGIRNIYDSFFFGCGAFNRLKCPLVRRLEGHASKEEGHTKQ